MEEIITSNLWNSEPLWLSQTPCNCPKTSITSTADIPERKRSTVSAASVQPKEEVKETDCVLKKFLKLQKLIRVTACCMRFIRNCKTKDLKITGPLNLMN